MGFFGPGLQRNGEALRHRGQTSAIHLHKVGISEPLDEKILAIKDILYIIYVYTDHCSVYIYICLYNQ